jgi:anti-sigma-K factor RskA
VNVNDIIESGLIESYVLGTANAEDVALIQELSKKHPELVSEIEKIEESLIHFSSKATKPLPAGIKEKILNRLDLEEKKLNFSKIIPINDNKLNLYKFGMAASLLLFVSSLFYAILLQQKLNKTRNELADAYNAKSYVAEELQIQKTSFNTLTTQLQIITDAKIKKVSLGGMNTLATKSAVVYWNSLTNDLYFSATDIQAPAKKQYQLWAIVNGKPIDAGIINLSADNHPFQKMKPINGAQAFAVTIENIGGSLSPSLETMCFLGNV